jgi:hypothetical protein
MIIFEIYLLDCNAAWTLEVDTNVSDEHTVSIFNREVHMASQTGTAILTSSPS